MTTFNALEIPIISTPKTLPTKGNIKVYQKLTDGRLYQLDSNGVETLLFSTPEVNGGNGRIEMINNSALRLESGYVVRLDETMPFAITTFPEFQSFQVDPFGIVEVGAEPNEKVVVQYLGVCLVTMDANAVNVGDYIYNSQIVGLATPNESAFTGAIGRALEGKADGVLGKINVLLNIR